MKLSLPSVTLVVAETIAHELASLAINDCLSFVDFGDVAIYSDRFDVLRSPGAQYHLVDNWSSKERCVQFCYSICDDIKTPYQIFIEWDSGIIDPQAWKQEFLDYDYIGSPWGYTDSCNVGNGGFSLRSNKLMKFLSNHKDRFNFLTRIGDDSLCRSYRKELEQEGFKWAPEPLAHDFAFERRRPSPSSRHFGYHGMFNWPFVFPADELKSRMKLAAENKYIRSCSMWRETLDLVPWLQEVA